LRIQLLELLLLLPVIQAADQYNNRNSHDDGNTLYEIQTWFVAQFCAIVGAWNLGVRGAKI